MSRASRVRLSSVRLEAVPMPLSALAATGPIPAAAPSGSALAQWLTSPWSPTLTGLGIAAVVLALFFNAILRSGWVTFQTIDESVARGGWIIANHSVQTVDPFSWWMGGNPWQNSEWLADLLYALAYRSAGWPGTVLLVAIAISATGLIMGLSAARRLGGPLLITLGVGANELAVFSCARQQTLALPFMAAWAAGLILARDQKRAPPFWLLICMTVWVNLHGSFIFGLVLIGPFAIEAMMEAPVSARFTVARTWTIFGLAAAAAALFNPYGIDAFTFPFRLMAKPGLLNNSEWQPLLYLQIDVFLAALIGGALLLLRVSPMRIAIVIALLGMACQHERMAMLLALITPMLLAGPIANVLDQKRMLDWRRAAQIATFTVVTVGAIFGAESLAWRVVRGDGVEAPGVNWGLVFAEMKSALDAVPPPLRSHRVFNQEDYGPYLIFAGVHPMVDDRVELYGAELAGFAYGWFDEKGIDWTFDMPNTAGDAHLNADQKWISLYRGNYVSVHARRSALDAIKGGGS
jgi:hypothetical protein